MSDEQIAANAEQVLKVLRVMMMVVSHRVMMLLAMLFGAGISVWAASSPDVYRTIVAVAWWPLVYWPALWAERKKDA